MTPWYLTPEALAIIAEMRRPKIKHTSQRYPLTVDHFYSYTGAAVAKLSSLYARRIAELDAIVPYPHHDAASCCSPSAVLGAVFGDPASGGGYKTHWDTSDEWAAIRDAVNDALAMQVAA